MRYPVVNVDFSSYVQRALDVKPQSIFYFVPGGAQPAALAKTFAERGVDPKKVRVLGSGEATSEPAMKSAGDALLGIVTAWHYDYKRDSDLNREFVRLHNELHKRNPDQFSLGGYDGMHLIYEALKKTGGKTDGDALIDAAKGMSWESPRGTMAIDPETRDVVQTIYIYEVRKVGSELVERSDRPGGKREGPGQGADEIATMPGRILTTHVGSLPRPRELLDMMKARLSGAPCDRAAYDAKVRDAVFDIVARQVACGLDIVADGEQSKPGFFTYVRERLTGFEPRPELKVPFFEAEVSAFPEYYADYFARAMGGGGVAPISPMVCVGPVSYTGREALARDIQNLKDALPSGRVAGAFMPSIAPSGVGLNEHYRTDEEFYQAVGNALREEYQAIVDAGFLLQIDDPFLSDVYSDLRYDDAQKNRKAGLFVEALNHALEGIPEEKVRFHTCYGINEGPRIFDAQLKDVAGHMLKVKARFYSFEGANARHEHEYHYGSRFVSRRARC